MNQTDVKLQYLAELRGLMKSESLTATGITHIWDRVKKVCDSIEKDLKIEDMGGESK